MRELHHQQCWVGNKIVGAVLGWMTSCPEHGTHVVTDAPGDDGLVLGKPPQVFCNRHWAELCEIVESFGLTLTYVRLCVVGRTMLHPGKPGYAEPCPNIATESMMVRWENDDKVPFYFCTGHFDELCHELAEQAERDGLNTSEV